MEKFRNLPKGTVVELTEKGKAYWGIINGRCMTIVAPYEGYTDCGYDVEELDPGEHFLSLHFIKRVVRYPVDTESLKAGVSVKLRTDLSVGRKYAGVSWSCSDEERFKGEIVKIKGKLDYCGVPAFRVSREDGFSTIISAEMVKQIISESEAQAEKEIHVEEGAKEVTHMKHEDIKVGMKLKLRDDLVEGEKYGSGTWYPEKQQEEYLVTKCFCNGFDIEADCMGLWLYTAEMFECEIKEQEVVTGAEALIPLGSGKILEQGGYCYWIEDNEVKAMLGQDALPETMPNADLNSFLKQSFTVLDELPDFTQDNPFNVGDIVVNTLDDSVPWREVTHLVGGDKVRVRMPDGRKTFSGTSVKFYRHASAEEKAEYWKTVALHLRQEGGC